MTVPLTDPRDDFLAQDPTILRDPRELTFDSLTPAQWAQVPMADGPYKTAQAVFQGLSIAIAVTWLLQGKELYFGFRRIVTDFGGDEIKRNIMSITRNSRNVWSYMVQPALQVSARLGTTGNMTQAEELAFARHYADQIFDYINETSAESLTRAYRAQLADKWSPDVALTRALAGYGADRQTMNQYLRMLKQGEGREVIPTVARGFISRAVQQRAQKIAGEESFRAGELAKTVYWMSQAEKGMISPDATRKWLTAHDERVCKVCGPMDEVTVKVTERFTLPDGNKVWAPSVHPNCRCQVELSYPEFDHVIKKRRPWQESMVRRDEDGQFATQNRTRVKEPETEVVPVTAPVSAPVSAPVTAPAQPVTVATPVTAPLKQEVATPVKAPVSVPVTVAVVAPVKKPLLNPKKLPPKGFQHSRQPYYVFANDWLVENGDTRAWEDDDELQTFRVGDVIHIDNPALKHMKYAQYSELTPEERDAERERASEGRPEVMMRAEPIHSVDGMALRAATRYFDANPYEAEQWEEFGESHKAQYETAVKEFQHAAIKQSARLVGGMTTDEVKNIYTEAGERGKFFMYQAQGLETHEIKAELLKEIRNPRSDGSLQSSYLHFLGRYHADLVRPPEINDREDDDYERGDIVDYQSEMDDRGIQPHVVNVFEFNSFQGNYMSSTVDEDEARGALALMGGKYQVHNIQVIPITAYTWRVNTPAVSAVRVIQIEPVIDFNS